MLIGVCIVKEVLDYLFWLNMVIEENKMDVCMLRFLLREWCIRFCVMKRKGWRREIFLGVYMFEFSSYFFFIVI